MPTFQVPVSKACEQAAWAVLIGAPQTIATAAMAAALS
jgi:hypothetical protein